MSKILFERILSVSLFVSRFNHPFMRFLFSLFMLFVLGSARPAAAQSADARAAAPEASRRLALAARHNASAERPMRLACAPLGGQVFDPNGEPLQGATLLVQGTYDVYVTDADGRFQLTAPVYEGQVLTVQAAGYTLQEVPLTDCALPRLVLELMPGAHIRHSGKRAGQVTRLDGRNTTMK